MLYDSLKAVHILAVIAWMAGMLYLPRLFVYHAGVATGSETSELFKVMEKRLLRYIMTPAMLITWGVGIWLMAEQDWHRAGWFHAKLTLVLALSGLHGYFAVCVKKFARDANTLSPRVYRILNEIPTVLLIVVVFLVVVKPF
jgi:protoporphyrinogen IX oxidase